MEYQDVRCAAQVMAALQGSFLLSSDRGPIRIEYAKSKMAAEVGYLPLLNHLLTHSIQYTLHDRSRLMSVFFFYRKISTFWA